MLARLTYYPTIKVKKTTSSTGKREKNTNPYFSRNFEIQEPEDQEKYNSQSNSLNHNDLNAFVVDWEIPKLKH